MITAIEPKPPTMLNQPRFHKSLIKIAVGLWVIGFFGLCARTLVLRSDHHSVFADFTTAGTHWIASQPLYVKGGPHEFRYSPLVAAFFVPFSLVPLKISDFVWRSLNFTAFIGGLFYCCKIGLPRKFSSMEIAAVFLLVLPLAIGSLNNAQSNPLVLGLMLISAGACLQKRWTLSAIAITLATCFKLYPIALGLLLVLQFPRPLGWRLTLCLLVAAVLPFGMQHWGYVIDEYRLWAHYLISEDRQGGPIRNWYCNFRTVWRIYVVPMSQRTYLITEIAAGVGIAILCLLGRLKRWPVETQVYFSLLLACCWMTVMGPATESSTYILLAPVIAWPLVLHDVDRKDWGWRIAYAVALGIFIASQLALNIPGGGYFRSHLRPLPVAGILLTVTLVIDAIHLLWVRTPRAG